MSLGGLAAPLGGVIGGGAAVNSARLRFLVGILLCERLRVEIALKLGHLLRPFCLRQTHQILMASGSYARASIIAPGFEAAKK